ncbi:ABC transporter ATP-binding protein [Opitutales bacterium ASA1]|uniref:ABC transporter ATP-binding protein n=1 Tax=Congregicoccus parvus TaxID=3081749 RepID=UPI002B28D35C|nr:ABC transporter ATP-binding protein [Opitutales bacterium ASA1]
MESSVELLDINKSLGGIRVVRDVSLSIRRGEFFSLLGPSGCGKSTTLRLVAGFEKPDSGRIRINGQPTNGVPAFVRDINLVFQHYALFPHMTVRQNVAFGLEMEKVPRAEIEARVGRMIELVRLGGFEERYPRQLSGGQQQRVALARALVTQPSVVLLDEPLGALDLKLRKEMQFELKNLQRTLGHTFIYVTHDQEEALAMSDRMAVMHQGRVVQVGTPEEVYERPATRFVADFIGEANLLHADVSECLDGAVVVHADGLRLHAETAHCAELPSRIVLGIRPEKVRMGSELNGSRLNRFSGVVENTAYFGAARMVHVRLTPSILVSLRQRNDATETPRAGERVEIGLPVESLVVLQPDA